MNIPYGTCVRRSTCFILNSWLVSKVMTVSRTGPSLDAPTGPGEERFGKVFHDEAVAATTFAAFMVILRILSRAASRDGGGPFSIVPPGASPGRSRIPPGGPETHCRVDGSPHPRADSNPP